VTAEPTAAATWPRHRRQLIVDGPIGRITTPQDPAIPSVDRTTETIRAAAKS
jgi:hypothetical protein